MKPKSKVNLSKKDLLSLITSHNNKHTTKKLLSTLSTDFPKYLFAVKYVYLTNLVNTNWITGKGKALFLFVYKRIKQRNKKCFVSGEMDKYEMRECTMVYTGC